MTFSVSSRLVIEVYTKGALKSEIRSGIATPGQKDAVKGLRILVGARLPDGRDIPAGSVAYIREEVLHTQQWASKPLTCDFLKEKFLLAEIAHVEFISTPDNAA